MTVFRVYWKIFSKNITSILITFGVFLLICLVFIGSNPQETYEFEERKVRIAFANKDEESELINGFIDYIENYAIFIDVEEKYIDDAIYYREIYLAVTVPEDFNEEFFAGEEVSLIEKSIPDAPQIITVKRAINKYFNTVKLYLNNTDLAITDIVDYVKTDLEKEIIVDKDIVEMQNTLDATYYYNYLSYFFVAVLFDMVGIIMISFRKKQIKQRIFVSPISQTKLNLKLVLYHLLFTAAILVIMCAISFIFYFDSMSKLKSILYILNALCLCLCVVSMGYMFSLYFKKKSTLGAFINVVALGTSFLSGAFVPQDLLSDELLKFAHFLPNYYYIFNNNQIAFIGNLNHSAVSDIFKFMGIQLLFGIGFMLASFYINRKQMTSEA